MPRKRPFRRHRSIESLERREVCAAWQNLDLPCDVDGSDLVTSIDAIIVINAINRDGIRDLSNVSRGAGDPYLDANGDNVLSPLDPLVIINAINKPRATMQLAAGVSLDSDPNSNGFVLGSEIEIRAQSHSDTFLEIRREPLSLQPPLQRIRADGSGTVLFRVPVALGPNRFLITAKDELGRIAAKTVEVRRGDVLQDWNAAALNVIREWTGTSNDPFPNRVVPSQPPIVAKNLAMVHVAMFDTINNFHRQYESYLATSDPPSSADPILAAASAAHTVASALYSAADERAVWDASLAETLVSIASPVDVEISLEYGRLVGRSMLQSRVNDGAAVVSNYSPGQSPGDWNRTPSAYLPPLLPQWANVRPFVLQSPSQFRPDPPPELSSAQYITALDEVMRLGSIASSHRTQEQSDIAVFWADGAGTSTPPGHWNQIASEIASRFDRTPAENARMFAILNLALADAAISCWEAKYHYDFWRPISAIRWADETGSNELTDSEWLPFLQTPPFPGYTSGHSTFSAAAATILTALLGDNISFTTSMDGQNAQGQKPVDPSEVVTRSFTGFHDAAKEASQSRVYGGIHFQFDCEAGLEAGELIGNWVLENSYPRLVTS